MSAHDIRTGTSTADDFMPAFASATDLGEAIGGRRLSSRELLDLTFQRVNAHNPTINAIVWPCREQALRRARQAGTPVPSEASGRETASEKD